jgi:hypothetical protein
MVLEIHSKLFLPTQYPDKLKESQCASAKLPQTLSMSPRISATYIKLITIKLIKETNLKSRNDLLGWKSKKIHVVYQYFFLGLQIRLFYQFDGWVAFYLADFLGLVESVLDDFALAHCDSFYFSGL